MKTLETGGGISTLNLRHGRLGAFTAVAPFGDEMEEMRNYTTIVGIDTSRVACVALGSENICQRS
jgi:hypothetical protein